MSDACRILVVDDDASLRKLMITAIRRRQRTHIEGAANGAEAIERLISDGPWTVLVLDLMMPTLSGWDVITWLAGDRARLPRSVIVVSAADREVLQKLDPSVVNALIFKPFDVFQLGAYVKAVCDLETADRRQRRLVTGTGS